ncbi:CpsD/CapB family tyrosine-protein kinase [uncultured Phascolarctobacterium sp.]|uniref:CpsD/CapB family tyrosine-protein kinase n=1 Tax=uncultured Phascolarctobacterium sp. TaxID=512296 RepID=UPI0025E1444E|nr:CpsD/CapB family tyrosine-protein kinase [uncultured Phascolarctobacterium sp.]
MEGINLIAHNDLKNPATEAYRVIRTSIQFAQAGKELKTLAVTSCIPNDGKSMTAANLAVVLTQAGKSVLLIDCDMRNPTVHKNFNLSNKVGLSSCISMGTALSDAVQKTSIEGLYALTGGVIPPNPSELLGSEQMKNVLQRAKEQYDYVLIDTPPVMPVTDALIVSRFVDGMILVIASAEIKVEMARDVKNQLQHAGANILGVVLNKVRSEHHGYGYGYYYYYGSKEVSNGEGK